MINKDIVNNTQIAVRHSSVLFLQRGLVIIAIFIFAVIIPRWMGPNFYGQYVLVVSLSVWFVLLNSFGFREILCYYIPQYSRENNQAGLKDLLNGLIIIRLVSGLTAAGLYLLVTLLWLQDIDAAILFFVAGIVFIHSLSDLFFELFLGLNSAGRWGFREILRRWISLFSVPLGYYLNGLNGACLGLLITELVILFVGIWLARPYLPWPITMNGIQDITPQLKFGMIFFVSFVMLCAFRYSGEIIIRAVLKDYSEISFFGLAYEVYLIFSLTFSQIALAFIPLLTNLRLQNQRTTIQAYTSQLLKGLTVLGVFIVFGIIFLGDWLIPFLIGSAYQQVAVNLIPLAIAMLTMILSWVVYMLTVVYNQPRITVAASGLRILIFLILGSILIGSMGSFGGCIAVLVTSVLFSIYYTFRIRKIIFFSLRRWIHCLLAGGLFLPLILLKSDLIMNSILFVIFILGYTCSLLLFNIIRPNEFVSVWRMIFVSNKDIISLQKSSFDWE